MQIVVDDVLLNYEVVNPGKANTVVVVHGWGHKAEVWLTTVNLMSKDWRYVLLDLPGFGQSSFIQGAANVPEYSILIKDFLSKLKIFKPVLIGHSFGGQIGLDLALHSPNLLKKLILVSPAGVRKKTSKQKIKVFIFKKFKSVKKVLPNRLVELLLEWVSSSDYYYASEEHREILKKITSYDLSEKLDKIKVPTRIVWGDKDEIIPFMGKRMVDQMKDAELYVMYGLGHSPHIRSPKELARMLTDRLEIR